MKRYPTLALEHLQHRVSSIAWELVRLRYHAPAPQPPWQPRLNVYRYNDRIVVCAELSGVARDEIALRVEPHRVWLSGRRRASAHLDTGEKLRQILALEIDEGRFERMVPLPAEIVPASVVAEQRNGLLWISLPLRNAE